MLTFKTNDPWWDKPAENESGDDVDVIEEEEEVDGDEPEDEFEALLAKDHPDLVTTYQKHTAHLMTALRAEREGNKKGKRAARQLKILQDEKDTRDRKGRTDLENVQNDLEVEKTARTKAETELRELKDSTLILKAASSLHFIDPEDAGKYLDMSSLERDDRGGLVVKEVEAALKDVIKSKPYLAKKASLGDGNDTDTSDRRKLDDDPKTKKKVKQGQPKIAI